MNTLMSPQRPAPPRKAPAPPPVLLPPSPTPSLSPTSTSPPRRIHLRPLHPVSEAHKAQVARQVAHARACAAAARLEAAKRAVIAGGLAARQTREREVIGSEKRSVGARRMSAPLVICTGFIPPRAAVQCEGPERVWRRRMAFAAPPMHSPATTEAAIMLAQMARAPFLRSAATHSSTPSAPHPTDLSHSLQRRLVLHATQPRAVLPEFRNLMATEERARALSRRLEEGLIAKRRGRLLKPLRIV